MELRANGLPRWLLPPEHHWTPEHLLTLCARDKLLTTAPWISKQTCCDSTSRKTQKRTILNRYLFILLNYNILFCRKKKKLYLFEIQAASVDLHKENNVLYFLVFWTLRLFLSNILTLQAQNWVGELPETGQYFLGVTAWEVLLMSQGAENLWSSPVCCCDLWVWNLSPEVTRDEAKTAASLNL